MFTGLIQTVAQVVSITAQAAAGVEILLTITQSVQKEIAVGDSVALDGACMTAVPSEEGLRVQVSPESLARTTLGLLKSGSSVNVELAMKASDRLGGHFVSGHVDCVAKLCVKEQQGDYWRYAFELPTGAYAALMIEKGSIAVNGTSLTINACSATNFEVMVIPHTLTHTNLGELELGDSVNIEFDQLGKYVQQLLAYQPVLITPSKSEALQS